MPLVTIPDKGFSTTERAALVTVAESYNNGYTKTLTAAADVLDADNLACSTKGAFCARFKLKRRTNATWGLAYFRVNGAQTNLQHSGFYTVNGGDKTANSASGTAPLVAPCQDAGVAGVWWSVEVSCPAPEETLANRRFYVNACQPLNAVTGTYNTVEYEYVYKGLGEIVSVGVYDTDNNVDGTEIDAGSYVVVTRI